jgi:hypothetical protein
MDDPIGRMMVVAVLFIVVGVALGALAFLSVLL